MSQQHIVPAFYIRNFLGVGIEKVWVYDKQTGRKADYSPNAILKELNHYDAPDAIENGKTADNSLQVFETTFAPVIKALPKELHVSSSTASVKGVKFVVSKFAVMQFLRGRMFKKWQETENAFFEETAQQAGIMRDEPRSIQRQQADAMLSKELSDHYTDKLLSYTWSVRKAPDGSSFYLGDEPIVSYLERWDFVPMFDSPGVEVHVPISPEFCFCITASPPGSEGDRSLTTDEDFVLWQRYLASIRATRYVVCRDDDFRACEATCRLHPGIKDPTRETLKFELVALQGVPCFSPSPPPAQTGPHTQ